MSLADARQFVTEVEVNPDLRAWVAAAHWDMAVVFDAAAQLNLSFTEDELSTALDQLWGILEE
jgi:hypothetical protein